MAEEQKEPFIEALNQVLREQKAHPERTVSYKLSKVMAEAVEQYPSLKKLNDLDVKACELTNDYATLNTPSCHATREVVAKRGRE